MPAHSDVNKIADEIPEPRKFHSRKAWKWLRISNQEVKQGNTSSVSKVLYLLKMLGCLCRSANVWLGCLGKAPKGIEK